MLLRAACRNEFASKMTRDDWAVVSGNQCHEAWFVGKAGGKVLVTFRVDEGRGVLVVHDDGLGLPDLIDFKNSPSLGLRLVRVLSRQIGGTVRAERGNGTKVVVEFPSPAIHEED